MRLLLILFAGLLLGEAGAHALDYTVQRKDTLSSIARKHGVAVADIIKANRIPNPDRLRVGQALTIPTGKPADIIYIVKKGDALSAIARRHGVSTRDLIEHNKLASPDNLRVGDRISIPAGAVVGKARRTRQHVLPASLRRELDRVSVKKKRWKYIVVHHSATARGSLKGMERYHREERRMENGLAYHFVIGNGRGMTDGKIEIGSRWPRQLYGGHMASQKQNNECIGICLVGNFDKRPPTPAQMRSLHALTTYLTRVCHLDKSRIKTHTMLNTKPTRCPGKYFPYRQFQKDFYP